MSKKRPSILPPLSRKAQAYWRGRLFRNSYTHNGRRFRVRAWCVKIQHKGQRRTFSLLASRKTDAALEAHELYQSILRHGWNWSNNRPVEGQPTAMSAGSRTPPEPRLRLVQRPSYDPTAPSAGLSMRIEHDGTGWYFPLGFSDSVRAAKRAREIYTTVQRQGWTAACAAHPRELTVAVHWASNPLVWTYATLHTKVESLSNSTSLDTTQKRLSVALLEPDAGIREALASYIDHHASFHCAAKFESSSATFARLSACSPDLIMANYHMPGMEGPKLVQRLRSLAPACPCLLFSVYEDSAELFKSTPSGSAGYLLRRTPPGELLAPIAGVSVSEPLDAQRISRFVFKYFYDVLGALQSSPAAFASTATQKLTPRECQVLDWLSRGYVDKEIAVALNISAWTVHGHLKNIFEKLGVHSRTEAVVRYLQR